MSILSSISSGIKSLASGVYNTVTSIGNSISNALSGSSQTAGVMNFNVTSPNGLGNSGGSYGSAGYNAVAHPAPQATSSTPGGTTYYGGYSGAGGSTAGYSDSGNNMSQSTYQAPVSYKSLMTPTGGSSSNFMSQASGGAYSSSNYASPSYSSFASSGSSGNFSAPVSTTVNASNIGTGTTSTMINSAPSVSAVNHYSSVLGNNIGLGADPNTGQFNAPGTTKDVNGNTVQSDNQQNTAKAEFDKYIASLKAPASQADAYNRAQQESGLFQAQQQRNDIQNQVNGVTAKMNSDLLQLRSTAAHEGVTEAVYGGQQAEVTREATIKLLPMQAQLAAAQNNLQLAQDHTDTLFKIYATDAQNAVDNYNNQVKAGWDFFTGEEKKKAEELLWQKNYNADIVKTEAKNQNDISNKLLEAGDMNGYRAVTNIRIPTNVNSPTYAQDYQNYKQDLAQVVAKYGQSIGAADRQKQAVELNNAMLQGQKLQSDIAANKPITGEYAPIINAVSSLVGAQKAPAVKNAISSAIAGGDFNTAYANIANSVEDSLTGTNKTKFADTRTDIGVMSGMRDAINAYTQAGGNLGYLKGTADTIAKKFGQLAVDPKFAALGVQLQREFQSYRLAMTGAAFSPAESKEYAAVNPRTNASLDLNLATIDGALAQLTNRVTSTINQRVPDAQKIYDLATGKSSSKGNIVTAPDGTQVEIIN